MPRTRSQATGEARLDRPLSYSQFREACDPAFVVSLLCSHFDIPEPKLRKNPEPTNGRFTGRYYQGTGTLCYNQDWTGLILHELAHHFVYVQCLNGRGGHHGGHFARVLQELIDVWI
jgi:hypothetical protein